MFALIWFVAVHLGVAGVEPHLVAKIPDGCEELPGSLHFSRDGSSCVYVAMKGRKFCPVVGANAMGEFDGVSWPSIDASGAHTVFRVAELDPRKKVGVYSILYDGKMIATDDWIGPVALDPAKGAPAYWIAHGRIQTSSGRPEPGSAALVWGKYKSAKWQYAEEAAPPQFAPDGKYLVTTAARGDGDWNVITVDDKNKEEKRGSGSIFEAAVRPGGHEIAYTIAHLEGGTYWMSHDQKYLVATESLDQRGSKAAGHVYGEDFSSTGSPVYSADGRHIAFKVMNESKMGVVIDDRNDARFNYEYVDEIALKPDGSEAAFVACTGCKLNAEHGSQVLHGVKATGGKWWVVYGKLRVGEYDLARFPAWSPDGTAIAYAAKRGEKWFVIAGSKQSEACDDVACVVWSNDGRCVWYGCVKGNELWWCKLDLG